MKEKVNFDLSKLTLKELISLFEKIDVFLHELDNMVIVEIKEED